MGNDAEITALRSLVTQLMQEVQDLRSRVDSGMGRIFLARKTNDNGQWIERDAGTGTLGDFTDGRACTDDAHASALIDVGEDDVLVAEFEGVDAHYFCALPLATGLSETISVKVNTAWDETSGTWTEQQLDLEVENGLIKSKTLGAATAIGSYHDCS